MTGSGQPGQRSPLDAVLAYLNLPEGWWGRITHLVLLAGVSVLTGFVLSPGLYGQNIPALGPDDVGRPFRATSAAGFKAGRDYEIENQALTESRRREARAAVQPVYDFNPSVHAQLRGAVEGAFSSMRELIAAAAGVERERRQPKHPRSNGTASSPDPAQQLDDRLWGERTRFEEKLFGASGATLDDEDFEAFLAARFSPEVEQAVLSLLASAYGHQIAAGRDELERDGAHWITIRDVHEQSEVSRSVAPPGVMDVREAQAELERYASVPGNILPDGPVTLRRAVLRTAKRQLRPDLTINAAETDARRRKAADAVKPAIIQIKKGQKVIGDGELIDPSHLVVLAGMRAQAKRFDVLQLQFGVTGLVALLIAGTYLFQRAAFRQFRPTRKDAVLLGALLVGFLAAMQIWISIADAIHDRYPAIPAEALYYAFPVAAGAMLVRFVLSQELALFFAVVLSVLSGVALGNSLSFAAFSLLGSLVASDRITRAKDRVGIFRAGLVTGGANAIMIVFLSLAEGKGLGWDAFMTALFALVGTTLFTSVTVMALTPLVEVSFGYASDLKLLELANLNHPALKELIVQAPGTYHHSIIIGSLVENAAEAIGANPLLARSCAYYHDIGKGKNPLYFGENQKGENRHDALAPAMSAVIIKRHVTDGTEMARHYRLPKLVADSIPQHHGTRVVGYFFHKAVKEQESKDAPQPIDESIYRYPGPKPQFQEAALVMIADAVEASTRSMPEPTTAKLQGQVQKIINLIFSEGQLDECDITLKDLNLIAQSFLHTLEGIYHTRPVYPPGALLAGRQAPVPVPALAEVRPAQPADTSKRTAGGGS